MSLNFKMVNAVYYTRAMRISPIDRKKVTAVVKELFYVHMGLLKAVAERCTLTSYISTNKLQIV